MKRKTITEKRHFVTAFRTRGAYRILYPYRHQYNENKQKGGQQQLMMKGGSSDEKVIVQVWRHLGSAGAGGNINEC